MMLAIRRGSTTREARERIEPLRGQPMGMQVPNSLHPKLPAQDAPRKAVKIDLLPCARSLLVLLLLLSFSAAGPQAVWADQNPPGCTPFSNVGLQSFRDTNLDGYPETLFLAGSSLVEGELIYYKPLVDQTDSHCGIQGGVLCVDLPSLTCPASNPSITASLL